MKRQRNFLITAVLAIALGGCAVLVQCGPADADAHDAGESLNVLNGAFAGGN